MSEGGCERVIRPIAPWRQRAVILLGRVTRRWLMPPDPCVSTFRWPVMDDAPGDAWRGPGTGSLFCGRPRGHRELHRAVWVDPSGRYEVDWSDQDALRR